MTKTPFARLKSAQLAAAVDEYRAQLSIRRWREGQGYSRVQMVDDVELHTHGDQVAEATFKGSRITVATLLVSGVVGCPC